MVCSTERSTPGSAQGSERASSLTLKTAVNPESEESSAQFQRNAYSGIPSLFFHSFGGLIWVTLRPSRDRTSSEELRQCPLESKRNKAAHPGRDQPSRQAPPRVRGRLRLGRPARWWPESGCGQHGRRARLWRDR